MPHRFARGGACEQQRTGGEEHPCTTPWKNSEANQAEMLTQTKLKRAKRFLPSNRSFARLSGVRPERTVHTAPAPQLNRYASVLRVLEY